METKNTELSLEGILRDALNNFMDQIQQGEETSSDQALISLGGHLAQIKTGVSKLNKLFPQLGCRILENARRHFSSCPTIAATVQYVSYAASCGSAPDNPEDLLPQLVALKKQASYTDEKYALLLSYAQKFGSERPLKEIGEEYDAVVINGFLRMHEEAGEKVVGLAYVTAKLDNGDWQKRIAWESDPQVCRALELYMNLEQTYKINLADVENFFEDSITVTSEGK